MPKIKSFSTSIGAKPMTAKAAEKEEPDKKAAEKAENRAEKAEAGEKGQEKPEEKKTSPAPRVMKPVMTSMGIVTKK